MTPDARSLIIIVSFRFQRSTHAPAKGLSTILGMFEKKIMLVNVVASPVCSYSQIPIANENNAVPIKEVIWPTQMRVKAGIPVKREKLIPKFSVGASPTGVTCLSATNRQYSSLQFPEILGT